MNLLLLGDIMAKPGRDVLKKKLQTIIKKNKIDFVIANVENADDSGKGITKKICDELFALNIDVMTSGNHIFDLKETLDFIKSEDRLLRPANYSTELPGKGFGIFNSKKNSFKVAVLNLIGNVFMKKSDDVFEIARNIKEQVILKKNCDCFVVDFHGEVTSEKMAIAHMFNGYATVVVGTHTHVPTADTKILSKGTAYQTDLGMCGDYDSVIGMNKENSLKKFFKADDAKNHFPADGLATISGLIVTVDKKTGLAKKVKQLLIENN